MRSWRCLGGIMGLAALAVTAPVGCTISIQPWTRPFALPQTSEPPLGNPAYKAPMPNPYAPNYPLPGQNGYPPGGYPNGYPPNGSAPNGYPPNAYPPNGYPPIAYGSSAGNESIAQLIKQLNETDDQRRALLDQVQGLKKSSRERDDNLQHASYEMEESVKQLKKTREEVRQFSGE